MVGNIDGNGKEHWKEVRDNHNRKTVYQKEAQGTTGKELIQVNQNQGQQV